MYQRVKYDFNQELLKIVVGFFYPVVPKGKSRIRVQISAAHTKEHINQALRAFKKIGKKYHIV